MSTRHEGRLLMSKALVLGAAALALSSASASAQVCVTPGFGYGYATPVADWRRLTTATPPQLTATRPRLMWRAHRYMRHRRSMQRQPTQHHQST